MLLPSRYNIALAKAAYSVLSIGRRAIGLGDISKVRRGGVNWVVSVETLLHNQAMERKEHNITKSE